MQTTVLVLLVSGALFVLKRALDYQKAVRGIHNHRGDRTLFSQFGLVGVFLSRAIPFVIRGGFRHWLAKHEDFKYYGADIYSSISLLPGVATAVQVADAAAIKEITSHRARFPKPVEDYKVLTFFGANIVASEGEQWKRFRKISAPAFSERNNRLVWEETVKIMVDLFEKVWGEQAVITTDHAIEVTLPIALFVIGVAGFGRRLTWKEDMAIPAGHRMAYKDALHIVSTHVFSKLVYPDWVFKLGPTAHLKKVGTAFDELESYMLEMIHNRRSSESKEERNDLFSSLLDASEDEADGQAKLTDRELMGNIFIFLVAGHETTAHTLCFTFALLALYQEEQEKLFQHIKSVLPDGRIPTYEEMNSLTQSTAVFYETLRLFPPVINVPKYAAEDTTLVTVDTFGDKVVVPVPRGTGVSLHIAGLHYNPRYWPDPKEFKPDRFNGDWPRDAFMPFSSGARSCLGRRFFETEGIAILTMLVSRYKIEVKEEPQFAGETFKERKERILEAKGGLTLTPVRVPLVFKRR